MPKKKLLVLLGAGSSLAQGMPSVGDLDREMAIWAANLVVGSARLYTPTAVIDRPTAGKPNYYDLAWGNRKAYYDGHPSFVQDVGRPNYERILGDLHGFMNIFFKKPAGDAVSHLAQEAALFRGLELDFDDEHLHYEVGDQIKYLCIDLARHIRQLSRNFESAPPASFAAYKALFDGLRDEFDLGVYTLNYDTVALTALPHLFTGFDTSTDHGSFLPADVHRRTDWNFIYHLHGSVHHSAEPPSLRPRNQVTLGRIVWENNLSDLTIFDDNRGQLDTRTDHRRMVPTTLVAGGWKLDQIQEDPFLTFYNALPRHAHQADAILIGGYGFGDDHINSVLSTMLHARTSRGPRPPVLVLGHTSTPSKLAPTLIGPNISPAWRDAGLGNPHFEAPTTPSCSVLLWRGGFENAGAEIAKIIPWLDSGGI